MVSVIFLQRIFKYGDIHNTSFTHDKKRNIVVGVSVLLMVLNDDVLALVLVLVVLLTLPILFIILLLTVYVASNVLPTRTLFSDKARYAAKIERNTAS